MTKKELIEVMSKEMNTTKVQAKAIVEVFFKTITQALREGESVKLHGIGTLSTKVRGARTGRHPITGSRMNFPSKTVPHFKPSPSLKKKVASSRRRSR